MKRFLTVLIALTLVLGLTMPALAETAMAGDLTEVTLAVKNVLDVPDTYTNFSSNYNDYIQKTWSLYWYGDDGSLDVTADENGKVLSAYAYTNRSGGGFFYGFDPYLPKNGDEAQAAAMKLLDKLMGEGEEARIESNRYSLASTGGYSYSGTILLNGLDSPVTFSLYLNEDLTLSTYYRSDSYMGYLGGVPGNTAETTRQDAAALLAGTVKTELYYVLDDSSQARLMYVPVGINTVVDALSGNVVDMDALYASFGGSGYGNGSMYAMSEAAYDSGSGRSAGLTEVELASIENYADVMDQDTLDELLRGIGILGLDEGFSLVNCYYTMDQETGDITASLRYTKTLTSDELYGYSADGYWRYQTWGYDMTISKGISLNAKTGELESVYTYYPLYETDEAASLDSKTLAAKADAFLAEYAAALYAESALCDLTGYNTDNGYTYVQQVNGYFYPGNSISVAVNAATGTVDSFSYVWDDEVSFAAAQGIVSQEAATEAYIDALSVTLGYIPWPEGVDYGNPIYEAYIDWGYTWVESLRLAWYYDGAEDVIGVDALTGEVKKTDSTDNIFSYDDLDGNAHADAIEALGAAGVGIDGGKFQPRAALTQRVAVKLLLQAEGYQVNDWDDETLGSEADYMGFISAEDWDPDAVMTRMDFIKAILRASKYAAAVEVDGIWSVSYSDAADAQEDLGYAALAQGLGLVTDKELRPNVTCTRAVAAQILYNFMSR